MKRFLLRLWNSPTLMSWGSIAARLLSITLVLPLVLNRFPAPNITVWLLFGTVISLQILGDLGFSQTFSRAIAYAQGGATADEIGDMRVLRVRQSHRAPNIETLAAILATMGPVFLRLMAAFFVLLVTLGSVSLLRPISALATPLDGWLAWSVVVMVTTLTLWGNFYTAYLQGVNEIAQLRRWEILFSLGGLLTTLSVLLLHKNCTLLELVLAQQSWTVLSIVRNRWLCHRHGSFDQLRRKGTLDKRIFAALWPSAWRSGVGILMSFGIIQLSGILYAQLASASNVAAYLLGLRMIQTISQFSQAPFYTKLPILAQLRSQGREEEQLSVAKQSMMRSHCTFTLGFLVIGFCAEPLLKLIHSSTQFVDPMMWALLGLAFLTERVGAMHLQLYSTTNHIIWHIANGWTGLVMLASGIIGYRFVGIYAFPLSMLLSYLLIYCAISLRHSFRTFNLGFRTFELPVSGPSVTAVIVFMLYTIFSTF